MSSQGVAKESRSPEVEGMFTEHSFYQGESMDSVEVSLLTCEPFEEIYALYGHTGLRIRNQQTGEDIVANWGIFDMQQKFFALKFMFGITDYRMAIEPTEEFCYRYNYYGCGIKEQVLNLTNQEKFKVIEAVSENYKPENLYYRYNYFYDNCTTRARDIVLKNITGKLVQPKPLTQNSFRKEIHQWNEGNAWARWGNDILLGVKADKKTNRSEQEFLPDSLRANFDRSTVVRGTLAEPLVKETRWLLPSRYVQKEDKGFQRFLLGPWLIVWVTLLLWIVMHKKWKWQYYALLYLALGVVGFLLTAMIFSQHPTVSLNLQLLVFNPICIVMGVQCIKKQHKPSRLLQNIYEVMLFLSILADLFIQDFAEGVGGLALLLLFINKMTSK